MVGSDKKGVSAHFANERRLLVSAICITGIALVALSGYFEAASSTVGASSRVGFLDSAREFLGLAVENPEADRPGAAAAAGSTRSPLVTPPNSTDLILWP